MHKRLLLAGAIVGLSFLAIARPAQAQVEISVIGGVNFASAGTDPSIDEVASDLVDIDFGEVSGSTSGVTGGVFGAAFTMPVTPKVDFRVEALFSQLGTNFNFEASFLGISAEAETQLRLRMLEIPFLVSFPVVEDKLCIQAGGLLGLKLGQTARATTSFLGDTTVEEFDENEFPIKSSFFGIAIGAEGHIAPKLAVGGRFNLGLTNLDDDPASPFDSVTARSVRVYATYRVN